MKHFVSTFRNKLDAKGRVSIPSDFRSSLGDCEGMFCYPAIDTPAVDAGGDLLVNQIQQLLENLAPYSHERDHLSLALFGVSDMLTIDSGGRIILPDKLKEHTGITDQAVFVGLGDKFQIWEPERFAQHLLEGQDRLRTMKRAAVKFPINVFCMDQGPS